MKHVKLAAVSLIALALILSAGFSQVEEVEAMDPMVNIGDITRIEGARSNQLLGYGLVVGLDGSGDSTRSQATVQSISNMLSQFGVEVDPDQVEGRNIAAVMVTADLPHDANTGDEIDVKVSSIGDADSLRGGTLVQTPLEAATGEIYAVAQGTVAAGAPEDEGHPTAMKVPRGAIVERTIDYRIDNEELTYILHEGNFRTASSAAETINENFDHLTDGEDIARAETESNIRIDVPEEFRHRIVDFIAEINSLEIRPATTARVVINEETGTISKGHNVRISTVSVSHRNLSVEVSAETELQEVENNGETLMEDGAEMEVVEGEREENVFLIEGGTSIEDLVTALNAVGADTDDLISILQEIEATGALHAELEIR